MRCAESAVDDRRGSVEPLRAPALRCLLATTLALLLPASASATSIGAVLDTADPSTLSFTLRLDCSGSSVVCNGAGLSSPYVQTRTSTLSGSVGLFVDDVTGSLQLSSDGGGTADLMSLLGSDMIFTGLDTDLTGNGTTTVTASNFAAAAGTAGFASIPGIDLFGPPQSILFSMAGLDAPILMADFDTNSPNFGSLALGPDPVDFDGVFEYLGDTDFDLFPEFAIALDSEPWVSVSDPQEVCVVVVFEFCADITATATTSYSLNFVGESMTPIPEPSSLLLVGLGLCGLGVVARRRQPVSPKGLS